MQVALFRCILLTVGFGYWGVLGFEVPPVQLQRLDNGFQVYIRHEPGIKYVAFNINRNRPFKGFEQGEFSTRIQEPLNNRWTFESKRALQDDDVIYIWTNVQYEQHIYRSIAKPINVREASQGDGTHSMVTDHIDVSVTDKPNNDNVNNGNDNNNVSGPCLPTITRVRNRSVCKGQLIFEETFDGVLNTSRWTHEVRLPLDTGDAEFVLYDTNTEVKDGVLSIMPSLWNDDKPGTDIRQGSLDLGSRCTGTQNRVEECQRNPYGPITMPPIMSARINTKHSFSFKYGRVEVRAKLPQGDWLFPLLLLEPLMNHYGLGAYISGEMRIAFIRSNVEQLSRNSFCVDGTTLYGGAVLTPEARLRESLMVKIQRNKHFGEKFHVYSLTWSDEQLSLQVDDYNYGQVKGGFANNYANDFARSSAWRSGAFMAPLDQEFYITLGVSAGGHGDFPNECLTKPWNNTSPTAALTFWRDRANWKTTWISPALEVDYVRVYAI